MEPHDHVRVGGCDIGKATATFVVASFGADGVARIESAEAIPHEGRAGEVFCQWYEANSAHELAALGATGLHADKLGAPVMSGLPEDACLGASLEAIPGEFATGALNIVSVGARGYSVLTRSADGHLNYVENDKCSSGTGETMVRIAGRFGLSIEEADRIAATAAETIPITARCSVFAKSEMTHFGNQGRPAAALFRGYFGSVAKYVTALLARARVDGPVLAVGGCARISTLVEGLSDATGVDVVVPEHHLYLEAIGAAALAAEQARGERLDALPVDPAVLLEERSTRFVVLDAASKHASMVTRLDAVPAAADPFGEAVVLGIDLGSTGSKAVLTSVATGDAVLDVYDRTRGNPVDALARLIRTVLDQGSPDVRAVGLTGSGREAAASVLRAAYPELADRIVTLNEIVAHATAAIRCDPDDGDSLSVVEIGGQDAKFIQISGGQIVESDMNKACSAGTGSFLEEQAAFYGVHDIAEFTRLATTATRPPDLGQMCTVFVAEAAAEAHNEGFDVADLFGGFQYSVVHNYINRVMGQRTFGRRIFFQGKPASGESLAWTLAAVTGREVYVPPNPGAMGAWGIGLCVIEEVDLVAAHEPFDLGRALGAAIVDRSEFQCRDKRCATLCNIERVKVAVGDTTQSVLSGGACPKYEVASATKAKLPLEAPSPFDERAALLAPYLDEADAGDAATPVGVPVVGALYGIVPWLVTFLRELGFAARVLAPEATSLARGEERCYSFDACAPVKVAHGVLDSDGVDVVFFPKVLTFAGGGKTCPMELAQPDMVGAALRARGRELTIVAPPIAFDGDETALLTQLIEAADALAAAVGERVSPLRIAAAARAAATAQATYEDALEEAGRRALRFSRDHEIPAVVVCGPLHVVHDPTVNAGIPRLLRENGVMALPQDTFAVDAATPQFERMPWADENKALRAAVAARAMGDVYPLLLSSFGCGPASFAEQIFTSLCEDYPHTTLESDGHGGTAGYVTRVQAFLHTARRHSRERSPAAPERLRLLEPLPNPAISGYGDDARFVMFAMADRMTSMLAAAYRAHGVDAVSAGPPDAESLHLGRRDCSGKECLPYQLIWGSFRKYLDADAGSDAGGDRETVLVQVTGEGTCRNCMFSVKDQITLERMGRDDSVSMRDLQLEADLGPAFMARVAGGLCAWDILQQFAAYYRPLEGHDGEVDDLYRRYCDELEALLARPAPEGGGTILSFVRATRVGRDIAALVESASADFAALGARAAVPEGLRTVLLSGDIYLRVDECANDGLIRRLNERGVLVAVEPTQTLPEYLAHEGLRELVRYPREQRSRNIVSAGLRRIRKQMYAKALKRHPWLPTGEIRPIIAASRPVLDKYPQGEAPVTIGSVRHWWADGRCDGVVVVSPWGCGPALVSEAMLRHEREIPLLFVYNDGSPLDERRLNAFVFRLRREPPRVGVGTDAHPGAGTSVFAGLAR